MTGAEFARIRDSLSLNAAEFALAFGYEGDSKIRSLMIRRMETGQRPIPPPIGRLAVMFLNHGVPDRWLKQD